MFHNHRTDVGLAGNHSLTTCEAYLEVLSNGADPCAIAWALEQSTVGSAGTGGTARVRNILNQFIREYKNTFYDLLTSWWLLRQVYCSASC